MSPEDQLCLLLARGRLTPEAEQRTRQLLAGTLAWDSVLKRVRLQEILPLFCCNLKRLGFPGVPPPIQAELADLFKRNALRNALLARELTRVLSLLNEEHVPVIPLKGIPLAESLLGDPALRVCADIDLLVPPKYFPAAFRILRCSGYEARFTEPSLVGLLARYGKDCALMRQDHACSYPLQLHCGLIWGGPAERNLIEEIWSAAPRTTFYGVSAFALSPEWEFLYLAVHAARHGFLPLKWLVDLDLLSSREAIDWRDVKEKARRLGWERAVQSSLSACAELLETQLPAGFSKTATPALARFSSSGPSPVQILREVLFAARLLTSRSQKYRFLAIRLFVPTPADCEWLPLPSWLFFLYYALRPLRVTCLVAWWFVQAGLRTVRPTPKR